MNEEVGKPGTVGVERSVVAARMSSLVPQGFFFLAQLVAYGLALAPCIPLVRALVAFLGPTVGWALGIAVGFHLAGVMLILVVAVMRLLLGGAVSPGVYSLDSPEARRWLRNLAVCEIARRSPFFGYVHHYTVLAVIFYRLMGAKVAWTVRIGHGARLTDPWLTHVAGNATIGEYALVLGHFIEGDSVVLRPVHIEEGATVGVMSVVSPGCRIEREATLGACSMLAKDRAVPAGELWVGTPAKRLRPAAQNTSIQPSS